MKAIEKKIEKKEKKIVQKAKSKAGRKTKKGIVKRYGRGAHKMLKGLNPYLETILDPFSIYGVKIPDFNMAPSVTFTTVDRFNGTANATFCCGAFVQCGLFDGAYATNGAGATSLAYTWNAFVNLASAPTVTNQTFNGVRLVSAGLAASYEGTTLSDSGRFICGFVPRQTGLALPPASMTEASSSAQVQALPMARKYAQAVYFPQDPSSLLYQPPGATSGSTFGQQAQGYIFIMSDGMVAGQVIQYTLVCNWEATPQNSTLSWLSPTHSPSDPLALSHASNVISNSNPALQPPPLGPKPAEDAVQSGVSTIAMSSGASHELAAQQQKPTNSGSSFLDSILGLAEGPVGQIASKALPLLSSFIL